jgi:hypothetical protein
MHGNTVGDPDEIREIISEVREMAAYEPMPIVFNDGDHFCFKSNCNMLAVVESGPPGLLRPRRERLLAWLLEPAGPLGSELRAQKGFLRLPRGCHERRGRVGRHPNTAISITADAVRIFSRLSSQFVRNP